jgi:hypothetical protein
LESLAGVARRFFGRFVATGVSRAYRLRRIRSSTSALVSHSDQDSSTRELSCRVRRRIDTIEHVFGPSLQEIAKKWREMAAPKSDGEKVMPVREISSAPPETRPDGAPRD